MERLTRSVQTMIEIERELLRIARRRGEEREKERKGQLSRPEHLVGDACTLDSTILGPPISPTILWCLRLFQLDSLPRNPISLQSPGSRASS